MLRSPRTKVRENSVMGYSLAGCEARTMPLTNFCCRGEGFGFQATYGAGCSVDNDGTDGSRIRNRADLFSARKSDRRTSRLA